MVQIAVAVGSTMGLLLSGYLVLLGMGLVRADSPWLPVICRMDNASCDRLLHSADAHLFGLPNAVCGLFYYGGVLVLALSGEALVDLMGFLVLFGTFAVLVSVYLSLRLFLHHRVLCSGCVATHLVNLGLLILFLVAL